jgi:AAA domain
MIDQTKLEQAIAQNIELLCQSFFPNGKKEGLEWKIGDSSGAAGRSLGISLNAETAGLWKDRAGDGKGNFTQLVMQSRNLSFPAAAGEIGRYLGLDLTKAGSTRNRSRQTVNCFDWKSYRKISEAEIARLVRERGYSKDFVAYLSEAGIIRACNDNGTSNWVFPIHKSGRIAGVHSRPINWKGTGRVPWRVFPEKGAGGPGMQPLVIGNLAAAAKVHLFESQWDQFGVCDRLSIHQSDGFASVCTRGAGNSGFASIVPVGVGEAFIWQQNDADGEKWAAKVAEILPKGVKARVVHTPKQFEDPNAWTIAGATSADLMTAITNAVSPGESIGRQLLGGSILSFAQAEVDQSQTLLGERYLCVGGGMFIVAQSGIGKSTVSIQAAALWACGRPGFDIKPARPLRILIVQAEDDRGDVTEASRMVRRLGLTPSEIALMDANTWIEQINDVCGEDFIRTLGGILAKRPVDLVIINPFTAYLGSDEKDTEACTRFLRNQLNPLLTKHRCAALIFHHTPKTNFSRSDDYKPSDWMYRGSGAATLTNWARAYLVIDPCEGAQGVYKFIAAKRGKRIGWSNREPCFEKYYRHAEEPGVILWEPANEGEISAAKSSRKYKSVDPEKLLALVPLLDPVLKTAFQEQAAKTLDLGIGKIKSAMIQLELDAKVFTRTIENPGKGRSLRGWAKTPGSDDENKEVGQAEYK